MNRKTLTTLITAGGILTMSHVAVAATAPDINGILSPDSTLTITTIDTTTTNNLLTTPTTTDTSIDDLNVVDGSNLSTDVPDETVVPLDTDTDDTDSDIDRNRHGRDVRAMAKRMREYRHDRVQHRTAVRDLVRKASEKARDVRRNQARNFDQSLLDLNVRDFKKDCKKK